MANPLRELIAIYRGPLAQANRAANLANFDDTRSWVVPGDPNGYTLSDRLWKQRGEMRNAIDDRLRVALANGEDAITVARDMEQYLNARYAPHRSAKGRIIRDLRSGVLTGTPRNGTGSYPARRLARTEVTRAYGMTAVQVADRIGAKVRWNLSQSHPRPDECDDNANRDNGYGPGVYDVHDVPQHPDHPHCLCSLSSVVFESDAELVERLRTKYGLNRSE